MSNPSSTNPSLVVSSEPLNNPPLGTISKESSSLQTNDESQDNNRGDLIKKTEDFFGACMNVLDSMKSNDKEKQQSGIIDLGKTMAQRT